MRRPSALFLFTAFVVGCGQTAGCGGCAALGPIPGGSFEGTRGESAAAARLTATGFDVLNVNADVLLQAIAPGGDLVVPLSCSVQNASLLGQLAVGDQGALGCTAESCGLMDGRCDAQDVPKVINIHFNTFEVHPRGPDQVAATASITISTGKIMMASIANPHLLCILSSGDKRLKLSVDLDTARAAPTALTITAGIRFTVDTRWWKLLAFEVAQLDGTKVCNSSGAQPSPACIDSADMIIASENGCSGWLGTVGNIDAVKGLILTQITGELQTRVEEALGEANCRSCDFDGMCPTNGLATSFCRFDDGGTPDSGVCFDAVGDRCVPGVLGVEGRVAVGSLLETLGAPVNAAFDMSVAAGGSTRANDAGFTLGFTGGAKEVVTASCVKPLAEPNMPLLPLPDFDADAPSNYDVGVSMSQQLLSRMMLHAQQSGALCLELGQEDVSLLDSSLVGTLLPSLNKLTHGDAVPLRVVVRPVNPPTASLGSGVNNEPLINMKWNDAEVDLYALLDDHYTRLFTVSFDLALPISLSIEGCSTLTPVIGSLTNAISDVHGSNNDLLAEPLTALEGLVPQLISFAEPALAGGLTGFTLPAFGDFQVRLRAVKGIGNISGTAAYNHLGVYAELLPATQVCVAMRSHKPEAREATLGEDGSAMLDVTTRDLEYSFRMPRGIWSTWRKPDSLGKLKVEHPRLKLDGRQLVELRSREGALAPSETLTLELRRPASKASASPRE